MENCYVLFVKTGFEEKIERYLKKILDSSLFSPFAPMKEKIFWQNHKKYVEFEVCFKGYVFVESCLCADDFIISISPIIRLIMRIKGWI